jgi:hypothetical protein
VRTRFTLGGPGIFPGRDFLFIFYMDPVFLLLFLYYSFDHIKKKNPSELLMVSLSFSLFSLSLSSWASTKKSRLDITEISSAETLMRVDDRLLCGGGEPSHVRPASFHSCLISCCLFSVLKWDHPDHREMSRSDVVLPNGTTSGKTIMFCGQM